VVRATKLTRDDLVTEIMRHWRAQSEAGTVCHFCGASVGSDTHPELMPHDPDCVVRAILTPQTHRAAPAGRRQASQTRTSVLQSRTWRAT